MILLPVSHEDSVVRRMPWVSIGIFSLCLALQVHSCVTIPELEERAVTLTEQMVEVRGEIVAAAVDERLAQAKRERAKDGRPQHRPPEPEPEFRGIDVGSRSLFDEIYGTGSDPNVPKSRLRLHREVEKDFDKGTLCEPGGERCERFAELKVEMEALEQEHPYIRFGYRPALDGVVSLVTSMFAHGGWLHLLGNMWFLYLVGCNLEDRWGRWQFASFYLTAGAIAALTFTALHRESTGPLVGASGAVAGAMGAFMVCFAKTKVKIFYMYWFMFSLRRGTFLATAWMVAGFWVVEQFLMTLVEVQGGGSGVAFSAHVGGFVFGALVAAGLKYVGVDHQLNEAVGRAADEATVAFSEDPLFIEAMEHFDQGNDVGAKTGLVALVAEQPNHLGAREALFNLGTRTRDVELLDYSVRFLLEDYARRSAHEPVVSLFRQLRAALPEYGLTDRELLHVATSAKNWRQPQAAITAVTELMQQHPNSALLPRGMLLAAEVQENFGSSDHRRDTLQHIMRRFPDHACATIAREQLATLEAVP